MEKKWAPAEKMLTELGRFVLLKPKVSSVLLASVAIVAVFGEGLLRDSTLSEESVAVPLPIPLTHSSDRFSRDQGVRAEWETILDPQGAAITFQHWPLSTQAMSVLASASQSTPSLTQLKFGQTLALLARSLLTSDQNVPRHHNTVADSHTTASADVAAQHEVQLPLSEHSLRALAQLAITAHSTLQLPLAQTFGLLASSMVTSINHPVQNTIYPVDTRDLTEIAANKQDGKFVQTATLPLGPSELQLATNVHKSTASLAQLQLGQALYLLASGLIDADNEGAAREHHPRTDLASNRMAIPLHALSTRAITFAIPQLTFADKNNASGIRDSIIAAIRTENQALRNDSLRQPLVHYPFSAQDVVTYIIRQNLESSTTQLAALGAAPDLPLNLRYIASSPVGDATLAVATKVTLPSGKVVAVAAADIAAANVTGALSYTGGIIHRSSLYAEARKAGLSMRQANQLVDMFSVNKRAQNLKPGDEFSVLYENPTAPGKKDRSDNTIVAAQLVHQGQRYQLIRFVTPAGQVDYYTPEGESLHQGILRAPVAYSYISSYYSKSRFEPVLHFFRPHLGVDYAAPKGTPIEAAGDGQVVAMSRRGGYGKTIVIEHDNKYSTLYAHMADFGPKLQIGSMVKQGQVIGYVGRTGLATGPHLHYEIHVNNVPLNPLTVDLPGAPIPETYRHQFMAQASALLAELNSNVPTRFAERDDKVKAS